MRQTINVYYSFRILKVIKYKKNMKEIWKDIIGFEGYYQISNYGNIISKDRFVNCCNNSVSLKKGKQKKTSITNGYSLALLSKDNTQKGISVHRLVGLHFVDGMTKIKNIINHKDGNRLNNHYSNLEWCTQKENIEHARLNGLQNPKKGDEHHFSKISDVDAIEIKQRFINNEKRKDIALDYNISYSSVCRIIKGNQRTINIPSHLFIDKLNLK